MTARLGWVALCVAAALWAGTAAVTTMALPEPFVDWQTYAKAVDRFLHGRALYALDQLAGPYALPDVLLVGYAYPPPSVLFFVPFASFPIGLIAWLVLNVGLLLSGLAMVVRCELGRVSPWALFWIVLSLALFTPFADGVANANLNVGLAGLLAWAWASDRHRWWIAPAAGVGAIIKLIPGALALWLVRRDGWRPVVHAALIAVGIAVLTLPLVGLDAWRDFGLALANAEPVCSGGRLSIACALEPVTGSAAAKLAGIAAAVLFATGALVIRNRLWAFGSLGVAMLAPVSDMHPHYWLILYVVLVVAVAAVMGERRRATAAVRPATREGAVLATGTARPVPD